ncbi:hypothetical protein Bca101_059772 [Brassica carinata]
MTIYTIQPSWVSTPIYPIFTIYPNKVNLFKLPPQDIIALNPPWFAIHSSSRNLHLDLFIRTYTSLSQTLLHSLLYLRLYQNVHLIFASTVSPFLALDASQVPA